MPEHVLKLDWDWNPPQKWLKTWDKSTRATLEHFGFQVTDIIMKQSDRGKGRGKHVWIHVQSKRELTDDEINMFQWLCIDDPTRVRINCLRIRRGLKRMWNKLFSHVIWRKPLPKRCQKCRIVKYLKEMEEHALRDDTVHQRKG